MLSDSIRRARIKLRSKRPQVRVLPGVPRKLHNDADNGPHHGWPFVVVGSRWPTGRIKRCHVALRDLCERFEDRKAYAVDERMHTAAERIRPRGRESSGNQHMPFRLTWTKARPESPQMGARRVSYRGACGMCGFWLHDRHFYCDHRNRRVPFPQLYLPWIASRGASIPGTAKLSSGEARTRRRPHSLYTTTLSTRRGSVWTDKM